MGGFVTDGTNPFGLAFVHLQEHAGVEALEMAAGDRAARNRHPALAHGTVERDFEGAGGDFRVVTVQRHLLLDHGLRKWERIEKI